MTRMGTAWCGVGAGLTLLAAPGLAWATWSIVAVDPVTREVGVAGASCTPYSDRIAGLVPGRGALVAQGSTNAAARDLALGQLRAGAPAARILATITRRQYDPNGFMSGLDYRQYGVATLDGPSTANFTGARAFAWAGAARGPDVSVQGNILRSPRVVAAARAAFDAPPGAAAPRLADRLMAALEAGARQGGDRRCARELPALSAFIKVAGPGDPPDRPGLDLVARAPNAKKYGTVGLFWRLWVRPEAADGRPSPVAALRQAYDRRRAARGY